MTRRRSSSAEIEVPGTPEEVWEAIATGPGISTWFVPTEVDGRPGGQAVFHLGEGQDAPAAITGWEPPARLVYEEPWRDDATLATEFLVEARAGGTCIVRVVSTFSTDGFDDDLGTLDAGWTAFLDNLRLYLTHFRGRRGAVVQVTGESPAPTATAWEELRAALGLERVEPGTAVTGELLAGTVERVGTEELLVRSDDALVSVSVFRWDDRTITAVREARFAPNAERRRAVWADWMDRAFPSSAARSA